MARARKAPTAKRKPTGSGANLGFEEKQWAADDKLRGHMGAAEHKHVVLSPIFLKYISDAFQERYEALKEDKLADPEDRDEYTAESVLRIPKEAGRRRTVRRYDSLSRIVGSAKGIISVLPVRWRS